MHPLYKPQNGETIRTCEVPKQEEWEIPHCQECEQLAYRIVTVRAADGEERSVPLCVRHYVKACVELPELDRLSRRDKVR